MASVEHIITWAKSQLEERKDGDIQWSVIGHETEVQAKVDCGLPKGVDWIGYEEVQIIESEDPTMTPGCSYRVAAVGEYVGEFGDPVFPIPGDDGEYVGLAGEVEYVLPKDGEVGEYVGLVGV